jgi:hypothetical protein
VDELPANVKLVEPSPDGKLPLGDGHFLCAAGELKTDET